MDQALEFIRSISGFGWGALAVLVSILLLLFLFMFLKIRSLRRELSKSVNNVNEIKMLIGLDTGGAVGGIAKKDGEYVRTKKFKGFFKALGFKSVNDVLSGVAVVFTIFILVAIFFIIAHISLSMSGNVIENAKDGKHYGYQFEYISILLGCITISISLSTVFPYTITRLITSKKIEEIIQEKILEKKSNAINKAIVEIFDKAFPKENILRLMRGDGDHSRMISDILHYQGNFLWSIGWASRALNRYSKIDKDMMLKLPYSQFESECIEIIVKGIAKFVSTNLCNTEEEMNQNRLRMIFFSDNTEIENYKITIRTFTSLLDYRYIRMNFYADESNFGQRYVESEDQSKIIDIFIAVLSWTLTEKEIFEQSRRYYFKNAKDFFDLLKKNEFYNSRDVDNSTISALCVRVNKFISTHNK